MVLPLPLLNSFALLVLYIQGVFDPSLHYVKHKVATPTIGYINHLASQSYYALLTKTGPPSLPAPRHVAVLPKFGPHQYTNATNNAAPLIWTIPCPSLPDIWLPPPAPTFSPVAFEFLADASPTLVPQPHDLALWQPPSRDLTFLRWFLQVTFGVLILVSCYRIWPMMPSVVFTCMEGRWRIEIIFARSGRQPIQAVHRDPGELPPPAHVHREAAAEEEAAAAEDEEHAAAEEQLIAAEEEPAVVEDDPGAAEEDLVAEEQPAIPKDAAAEQDAATVIEEELATEEERAVEEHAEWVDLAEEEAPARDDAVAQEPAPSAKEHIQDTAKDEDTAVEGEARPETIIPLQALDIIPDTPARTIPDLLCILGMFVVYNVTPIRFLGQGARAAIAAVVARGARGGGGEVL